MNRIKQSAGSVKKFASTRKSLITVTAAAITAAVVVLVMRNSKADADLGTIYDYPADHQVPAGE